MPVGLLQLLCRIASNGAMPDMAGERQAAVWTDSLGVLWIDLGPVLGHACRLAITGWEEGVACTSHLEDEVLALGLFESAGIPLSQLCQQPGATGWIDAIPQPVVDQLVRLERLYGNCQLATLTLLCRSTAAAELFLSAPLLFFALLQSVRTGYLAEERLLGLVAEKRTALLPLCGLPESRPCLRLLQTLPAEQMTPADLAAIKHFFAVQGWERVNHLSYVDVPLLKWLTLHPGQLGSRLLHSYDGSWEWRPFNAMYEDVLRIARQLGEQQAARRIGQCRTISEFIRLHDRLTDEMNRRQAAQLEQVVFGPPPLQGNRDIRPITDASNLHAEGTSQRHCVAGYRQEILEGRYYVYAVYTPERATLGVRIDQTGKPKIAELKLKCNAAPSQETWAVVRKWFEAELRRSAGMTLQTLIGRGAN